MAGVACSLQGPPGQQSLGEENWALTGRVGKKRKRHVQRGRVDKNEVLLQKCGEPETGGWQGREADRASDI